VTLPVGTAVARVVELVVGVVPLVEVEVAPLVEVDVVLLVDVEVELEVEFDVVLLVEVDVVLLVEVDVASARAGPARTPGTITASSPTAPTAPATRWTRVGNRDMVTPSAEGRRRVDIDLVSSPACAVLVVDAGRCRRRY
jgi:hypothetical protein